MLCSSALLESLRKEAIRLAKIGADKACAQVTREIAAELQRIKQGQPDLPFKPGDLVRLKSGGPNMTVDKIDFDGAVWVSWFKEERYSCNWFPSSSLEPAEPTKNDPLL